MHGGARSYLFDLGTGMYASGSLPWFEEIYARRGITFDEVFGACGHDKARLRLLASVGGLRQGRLCGIRIAETSHQALGFAVG